MSDLTQFVPIRLILSGWPTNILAIPPQIDQIGLADFEATSSGHSSLVASGTLQILVDIEADLPLIPGLSLAVLNNGDFTEFGFEIEYLGDWFAVALQSLSAALRFQTGLLKRMEATADGFVEAPPDPETEEPQPVEILMEGADLSVNSDGDFAFTFAEGAPALAIQPFMIGDTGVIIEVTALKLILSAEAVETLPDSIPDDWRGVYLEQATIHLPEGLNGILPDDVTLEDFFIGSGGFCGKVTGNWTPDDPENPFDEMSGDIFGFQFRTTSIGIEFKQNALVSGSIAGYLQLPFFDEAVAVEVGLTNDGDFTIRVNDPDGLFILEKDGIISIEVSSLEFVKEGEELFFKLTGEVTPELAGLAWPSFELKGLTIGSDGTVRVEGGWIELPDQKALDFHGFKLEIAKLGFGSDELEGKLFKWIGFSGGIQIIEALPLRGGVEGLKVMWAEDGEFKLKIGGVYLQFEIENVLTFDGSVYFIDEEEPEYIKEFRGGVSLNLIPINLVVDAQFITGKTTDYNYFYIAIGLDLPVGIPLGPPILGLYGLAGLYGQNMTLDYQALIDYEDVANRPDLTDASPTGKWIKQKDAMAFGAGVTVGTLPDVKFTVKAKVLFVILIPGPVLLIEGHAGMLSLGENYLMRVLAVLDPTAGTFLMNISASYQFPKDSGELLDVIGAAEAYFSAADPSSWHLYLGEDKPESKRIRADILNFFQAQTYLMVDNKGLLMGAWIGYGLDKKYGILRVVLEAWISGELGLSTMPLQAKGSITLYGNAELSASIVSLGISVEANVTAQAPKPLSISASLEVQLKTPLGKPKAEINLKWEKTGVPPFPVPLSPLLGIEHRKVTKNWEIPKYSPYQVDSDGLYVGDGSDAFPSRLTVPVVPPDVYLVLNFDKPVIDNGYIGANPVPLSSNYEKVGDYEFKYELVSVKLEYCDAWDETDMESGDWKSYIPAVGDYSLSGFWQIIPGADQGNTKLFLNATTPFEISRVLDNSDMWYNTLSVYDPNYPCLPEITEETICTDFEDRESGTYYFILVQNEFIFTSPFPMNVHGYQALWIGTTKALSNVDGYFTIECLNIKAQEPTGQINTKVIKDVIITAGIGYNSYIQFTNKYSGENIELYINWSLLDDPNTIPAYIYFPENAFPALPYKVWITCIVSDAPEVLFTAFDGDGNIVDEAKLFGNTGEAAVYKLESTSSIIRKIGMIGRGIRIIEICYEEHHSVKMPSILVTPPEDIVRADLYLSKESLGTVYLYDKENRELKQIEFNIPSTIPDEEMQPVILSLDTGEAFRSFLVAGGFDIIRVCGVTKEARDIFEYNSGLSTHLQTSLEETWGKHTAQILEPNKYYRLVIETQSSRRKNEGEWENPGASFMEYMFFKTGNPPGPPASTQTEVDDTNRYDLDGPLKDISAYIDYTIPAGATADEAQPYIYRSYDIGVVYNDSYIDQMYQMAGLPIKIRLLDNNNLPVLNAAGEELEFVNLWGDNPELSLTREETRYEDILNDSGCVTMVGVTTETNNEILASSSDLLLKPQIQYRALVMAGDMPVYEFAFLTSRYANFIHHIHSFQDAVWNHFNLLENPDYEIDATALGQILTNSEEKSVKFEQLMSIFDLNPRSLPERMEVALMNNKHQSYGLLLESPEPLDWDRTELTVLFANRVDTIEEADTVVKIIDGGVENVAVPGKTNIEEISIYSNNQWVDILVMATTDLSGFIVEYLSTSAGEGEEYQEYYRFPENSLYLAGTRIRIYNGPQPTSPDKTEHVNLYAGHQSGIFEAAGTYIRIKDTDNEILHTRPIFSTAGLAEVDSNIIKNQDGTRAFIFIKSGNNEFSELDNGIYRLDFEFKRDIGPNTPILKRFGFTDVEETFIEFSLIK
ncbi:MAG: hypothetical protein E3K36_04465 [Candidatus Brocadia sp.]|nr:hypothetical protein [Candidatus Brocadia sp.]